MEAFPPGSIIGLECNLCNLSMTPGLSKDLMTKPSSHIYSLFILSLPLSLFPLPPIITMNQENLL